MHRFLNRDPSIDGILVQLPPPRARRREQGARSVINPTKDVDGFHPTNAGLLALGRGGALVACTPSGCMRLLALAGAKLDGANAVVVGRSNIVGKPMAQLLLAANATVTIAHSRTRDLPAVCRQADVLVAAVGQPGFIRGELDQSRGRGGHRRRARTASTSGGKTKLVGDVAFDEAKEVAAAITPVPGGRRPMTIAMLLANTLEAAKRRASREAK